MRSFSDRLLEWHDVHGRKDLPWQRDTSPYRVWVSEIMLQQTQVATAIPYFERFSARFPDIASLADAGIDEVLAHWSGLGYYARARNLHAAARLIRERHDGHFPRQFEDVVALPGIGRSTAGAILAIACGQRYPILDGNAKRVLARHGAIAGWPSDVAAARALWEAAERHTPRQRVAAYTQAIMDLGATLCTRTRPACERCPVGGDCVSRLQGNVADFPGRRPPKLRPLRETTMVIAVSGGAVYLERRPPAGIWGGLWSLPELADGDVDAWCERMFLAPAESCEVQPGLRHSFSHYDLDIRPVVVRVAAASRKVGDTDGAAWTSLESGPPGGLAAPVRKLIDQLKTQADGTNR